MSDQLIDEEEEEDTIDQVRRRFPGVCGFKRSGSFYLDVLDAKMRVNTGGQPPQNSGSGASLGPVFQWQAGGSSFLIYWNQIVMSYGKKAVWTMDEDGITLNMGETMLKLTEADITLSIGKTMLKLTEAAINTTGDMFTDGVHTDSTGKHGSSTIRVGKF